MLLLLLKGCWTWLYLIYRLFRSSHGNEENIETTECVFVEVLGAACSMLLSAVQQKTANIASTSGAQHEMIITILGHSVLICSVIVFVCVHLSVWTCVGGHKCELADALCVRGWKTSITTKSVEKPAKEQNCLSAVFWPYAVWTVCACARSGLFELITK